LCLVQYWFLDPRSVLHCRSFPSEKRRLLARLQLAFFILGHRHVNHLLARVDDRRVRLLVLVFGVHRLRALVD
ncbi:hypothetical protein PMAYCL1PPCAC_26616, partial [Pristionchus mayeri]